MPEVRLGVPTIVGRDAPARARRHAVRARAARSPATASTPLAPRRSGSRAGSCRATTCSPRRGRLADRLCQGAPLAVRAVKEMAHRGQHLPWVDAVRMGEAMRRVALATEDAAEGMQAAREGRARNGRADEHASDPRVSAGARRARAALPVAACVRRTTTRASNTNRARKRVDHERHVAVSRTSGSRRRPRSPRRRPTTVTWRILREDDESVPRDPWTSTSRPHQLRDRQRQGHQSHQRLVERAYWRRCVRSRRTLFMVLGVDEAAVEVVVVGGEVEEAVAASS